MRRIICFLLVTVIVFLLGVVPAAAASVTDAPLGMSLFNYESSSDVGLFALGDPGYVSLVKDVDGRNMLEWLRTASLLVSSTSDFYIPPLMGFDVNTNTLYYTVEPISYDKYISVNFDITTVHNATSGLPEILDPVVVRSGNRYRVRFSGNTYAWVNSTVQFWLVVRTSDGSYIRVPISSAYSENLGGNMSFDFEWSCPYDGWITGFKLYNGQTLDVSSSYLFTIDHFSLTELEVEDYETFQEFVDSSFDSSVDPDLGGKDTDLQGKISEFSEIEQGYFDDAEQYTSEIGISEFSFDSLTTNSMSFLSGLITRFFDADPTLKFIILFPLFLGLTLYITGRAGILLPKGKR